MDAPLSQFLRAAMLGDVSLVLRMIDEGTHNAQEKSSTFSAAAPPNFPPVILHVVSTTNRIVLLSQMARLSFSDKFIAALSLRNKCGRR